MLSFVSPTGGDMINYLSMGRLCATGQDYWNPIRPQGFILYLSLPFRMGWPPEAVILMNLFLVAVSVCMAGWAWNVLVPSLRRRSWTFSAFKYAFIAAAHLVFMLGAARLAISDVPAACLALIAFWLFIIGGGMNLAWMQALAGLFLGLSVIFRVFYYYTAFVFAAAAFLVCFLFRRLSLSAVAGLILFLAFPVLTQFAFIHKRIQVWSLEDPNVTAGEMESEMNLSAYGNGVVNSDPAYGVDGVGNDRLYWYTCGDCMRGPGGWKGALDRGDYRGILKLGWMRNEFYFGSWVSQPAIADLKDRVFSGWIAAANWLAVLSAFALLVRIKRRWILGVPLLFAASVWFLSLGIHPESRFIMLVLTMAWSLAPLFWLSWQKAEERTLHA